MKKKIGKLQLKKTVVSMLYNEAQRKQQGDAMATAPVFSCKIYCSPTWLCPPPADRPAG